MEFNYDLANSLLESQQYDQLKQLIENYQLIDPEEDILYCVCPDYTNEDMMEAFFNLAPKDYDWSPFLEVFGDHLGESQLDYPELFNTIHATLKGAIKANKIAVVGHIKGHYADSVYEADYNNEEKMVLLFKDTESLPDWNSKKFLEVFDNFLSRDQFRREGKVFRAGKMSIEDKMGNINATLKAALIMNKVDIVVHMEQLKYNL